MNGWTKAGLVLGGVGALIGGLFYFDARRDATMTAQGTATVTSSSFEPDTESRSLDQTRVKYAFAAPDGRRVDGNVTVPGDKLAFYQPGRTIPICYNPQDPAVSRIVTADSGCGS